MQISLLRLIDQHFSLIEFQSIIPDDELGDDDEILPNIGCSVDKLQHLGETQRWDISITVTVRAAQNRYYPYLAKFRVEGVFIVDKKLSDAHDANDEQIVKIVGVNGVSILYGTVREMFANLAARGPFAPMPPLPTLDFRGLEFSAAPDQTEGAEPQLPSKDEIEASEAQAD